MMGSRLERWLRRRGRDAKQKTGGGEDRLGKKEDRRVEGKRRI